MISVFPVTLGFSKILSLLEVFGVGDRKCTLCASLICRVNLSVVKHINQPFDFLLLKNSFLTELWHIKHYHIVEVIFLLTSDCATGKWMKPLNLTKPLH
jgi:hypothetical protein